MSDRSYIASIVATAIIALFMFIQLFLAAFATPTFAHVYRDMLADKPLPGLTNLLLGYRWMFVGASVFWVSIAAFITFRRGPVVYLIIFLAAACFQVLFSILGLFLPLVAILNSGQGGLH